MKILTKTRGTQKSLLVAHESMDPISNSAAVKYGHPRVQYNSKRQDFLELLTPDLVSPVPSNHYKTKGSEADPSLISWNCLFHLCYVQLDVCLHLEIFIMSVVDLGLDSLLEVLHL